jgi:hypothetical protein
MTGDTQLLSARSVRWIDIGVIVWVVVWVGLGVLIWHDIRAQTQLSGDVIKVGTAVKDTGQALSVVGGLPLVGGSIGDFAAKIETMGAEVEASGENSRAGIERSHDPLPVPAGTGALAPPRRGGRGCSFQLGRRPGVRAVPGAQRRRHTALGPPAGAQ